MPNARFLVLAIGRDRLSYFDLSVKRDYLASPTENKDPNMAKGNNSHRKEVKKPKKEKPKGQPPRKGS